MSLRTEDIEVYLLAVELGGISAAARHMGLSKSVVSKRISDLERELGTSLLQRSTRRIHPSEGGRYFYEQARAAMNQLTRAAHSVSEAAQEICGELRILAPMSFGTRWLSPLIAEFGKANPRLRLSLELDDRAVDVSCEGYDVAIRITRLGGSTLIACKLSPCRRVLCCSPGYAARAGVPQGVEDIGQHACLSYSNSSPRQIWDFRSGEHDEDVKSITPRGIYTANNGEVLRDAVLAGYGLAVLPLFIVWEDLRAGRLVEVQPGGTPMEDGIFALYTRSSFGSAKLKALVQFLQASLSPPPWEVSRPSAGGAEVIPLFTQSPERRN